MSSFKLDQQFFTVGLKVSKIRCNHTDDKLSNKTKKDKFIHISHYLKPFDLEGDGNCMYHALKIIINEFNLEGCNDKWNQCTLIELFFKYYTYIHSDENHEINSVWKHFLHRSLTNK